MLIVIGKIVSITRSASAKKIARRSSPTGTNMIQSARKFDLQGSGHYSPQAHANRILTAAMGTSCNSSPVFNIPQQVVR